MRTIRAVTGQRLRFLGAPIVVTVEAVYFQGGQWKTDLRLPDGPQIIGQTLEGFYESA